MPDFDELRRLYEAGNEGALNAAANRCRHPAAEWVTACLGTRGVVKNNVEYMRKLAPGKGKGRTARWAQQARKNLVHLTRYAEVCRALKDGCSDAEAHQRAADNLANTVWSDGRVTRHAVRKSCELIRRERERDPEEFRRRFSFPSVGWLLGKK
jgi:hypothetical protein